MDASSRSEADVAAKLGAMRYLLIMLIQRLDANLQVKTADLMAGVQADWAALAPDIAEGQLLDQVFRETLDILQIAAGGKRDMPA
ncbi:MAG: hypothetical protein K2Y13_09940 [Burkholderiaceae bacterium]|uniref:Uncharacterized protein n=1 Tax=Herminiimonas contaminans TaxID=1111140 RepID=A0ABS0ET20_9BURK|nr:MULTISPECIES: hypothetical protein [Oxalobacteraceae]MBF8177002.1 hypothetical protein [Herminiimonas contaminans]MBX9799769.1 hypothetical protein [Burkholderiaceae bacterium]